MACFFTNGHIDPSSISDELPAIIPYLRTTVIRLIKVNGAKGYSMIEDYYSYLWVMKQFKYKDSASLINAYWK
jgi:hypothetical protein